MDQPAVGMTSRRPKAALCALASAIVLAACAGENLFTNVPVAGEGEGGPTVDVTTPVANATFSLGASIGVAASTTSDAGAANAAITAHYSGSDNLAYNSATVNLLNAFTADFNATLVPAAGQIAGQVYIVVAVTDVLGAVGKDSVKITIN